MTNEECMQEAKKETARMIDEMRIQRNWDRLRDKEEELITSLRAAAFSARDEMRDTLINASELIEAQKYVIEDLQLDLELSESHNDYISGQLSSIRAESAPLSAWN